MAVGRGDGLCCINQANEEERVAKKKRKDADYYEEERPSSKPLARAQHNRPHVGVDIQHLTVWAQRSVLGLYRGQPTPKERMHS